MKGNSLSFLDEQNEPSSLSIFALTRLRAAECRPSGGHSASCYNIPMPRMVKCAKLGRELPGLDEPPFDTELGQKIYENVSAEAWKMWAEHSKMLLNEYRLQPWKPEAQQFLVEQMQQYFFGEGAQLPKEFVPPPK
jgi:Fe-S cluster biosynthesis and repair protein YggX